MQWVIYIYTLASIHKPAQIRSATTEGINCQITNGIFGAENVLIQARLSQLAMSSVS